MEKMMEAHPHYKPTTTKRVVLLGMLFVTFLVVSNLTAFKVTEIHFTERFFINFPASLVFFPLTYFFDDILTEVYGFKMSRLIIWGGLVCSAIVMLCTSIVIYLPSSPIWDENTHHGATAYALVFAGSFRVLIASIIAYFSGEFLNSIILAKLKVLTAGRYFYLRIICSTAIGVGIDSVIFCHLTFWHIMPHHLIWNMILTLYLFKLAYEFVMLPATYLLTAYLKKADQIDYYDTHTKFNPFSLSLCDDNRSH
ncbi:MAG: VUT family protein [Gammaproteobacteria bacterium]|nr:MAG: VUT family protein [Gammaproteobacteria bacterium]